MEEPGRGEALGGGVRTSKGHRPVCLEGLGSSEGMASLDRGGILRFRREDGTWQSGLGRGAGGIGNPHSGPCPEDLRVIVSWSS